MGFKYESLFTGIGITGCGIFVVLAAIKAASISNITHLSVELPSFSTLSFNVIVLDNLS